MQDYYNSDELMHYGRKGMKWGQNIFGKVKSAAGRAKAKVDENIAERKRSKAAEKLRKKPLSQCTEAELKARFSRAQLEKTVKDAERNVEKVSAGQAFISAAAKQVIGPSLATAGKNVLTKWFESKGMDMFGLKEVDPFKDLRKDLEKVKLERDISDHHRRIKENNDFAKGIEDPMDKLKRESNEAVLRAKIVESKKKAYSDRREYEKMVAEDNKSRAETKPDPKPESKPRSKPDPKPEPKPKPESKPDPKPEPKPESGAHGVKGEKWKKRKSKSEPIVLREGVDYTVSDSTPVSQAQNTSAYRLGESYVLKLLPG